MISQAAMLPLPSPVPVSSLTLSERGNAVEMVGIIAIASTTAIAVKRERPLGPRPCPHAGHHAVRIWRRPGEIGISISQDGTLSAKMNAYLRFH